MVGNLLGKLMYASPTAPVQNKINSGKGKDLKDPDQLTIYGIEKLKQNQSVPAESQKLRTNTLIKKENAPNPQGTTILAQSQKLTSSQENKEELPSRSVRWTAEKLPSNSAPAPTPAPAIEPIDLSAISSSKLARLALLDSMNF